MKGRQQLWLEKEKWSLPFGIPVILNSLDIEHIGLKGDFIFLRSI